MIFHDLPSSFWLSGVLGLVFTCNGFPLDTFLYRLLKLSSLTNNDD